MSLFDKHRNADGTFDGTGILGEVSGLGAEEVAKIAGQVKQNRERLDACPWHEFEPVQTSNPIRQKYQCKNCKGEVNQSAYHWFTIGRAQTK